MPDLGQDYPVLTEAFKVDIALSSSGLFAVFTNLKFDTFVLHIAFLLDLLTLSKIFDYCKEYWEFFLVCLS